MPHFIDTTNLPAHLTRAERQYIEHLQAQNKDDSLRHYLLIECWNEDEQDWQPALFYEPTHDVVQALISELAPFWTHAQQPVFCACSQQYRRLLDAYREVEAATTTFIIPQKAIHACLAAIKADIATWKAQAASMQQDLEKAALMPDADEVKRLKDSLDMLANLIPRHEKLLTQARQLFTTLPNHVFYSQQDVANCVTRLLNDVMRPDEIRQYGALLVEGIQDVGINPTYQQERLAELAAALAPYHAVDLHPRQATLEPCPLCHLPRKYNFLELLIGDAHLFNRFITQLVGGKVRPKHLPRLLQALELWLFANNEADDAYQKKMFPAGSLTGMMLTTFRDVISGVKTEIASRLSSSSASTSTTSTGAEIPPPPLPASTPQDNSTISPN